ncbi:molybdopterin molybdotransferase MoeA [Bowmanella sp. Y26]|uniref:molybdopterin molybdotransferase MoeA n=1 Tax=Bowmanella yangjiangensis TaxID=2811230 RepID=UPI001BDC0A2D|nr:gephyrin-like molybdotransferase Glp [Bowmanella yangjiangensis]MBT1063751.1 molybdopterin molybdotransferase MoeA [Bowmanella yangjiangensis]
MSHHPVEPSPSDKAPALLPVEQALAQMHASLTCRQKVQKVALESALGAVLAEDVIAELNIPPHDNSSMDGYAVRAADLQTTDSLTLTGSSFAGAPFRGELLAGETVRIMTGAVIPTGADAVVMQEQVQASDTNIRFLSTPDTGSNIRRAGEDIRQGQVLLAKGHLIRAVDLGLLASLGIAEVSIYTPLKVAIMSSGDELVAPGGKLKEGQIFDSNRAVLRAQLNQLGIEVLDLGIVPDSKQALRLALSQAAAECDVLISSGGVSVGEADFTKDILAELGQIGFWKLAIKPGKPFAFGNLGECVFFGLPGNPVSAYVTFDQLVRPALATLRGQTQALQVRLLAKAADNLKKRPGRMDLQRGWYWQDENGQLLVKSTGNQGSGVLTSIANANCYIVLEQQRGYVTTGEQVSIQPF